MIKSVRGFTPKIASGAWLAENATVIGDVEIGADSTIWYAVTIRGDVMPIRIGKETNIQDNSVLHGTYQKFGVTIGDRVTVGHSVILHGCEIGDNVLVGMGSIVMDGAVIGEGSIVGAGTLVTQGSKFPPHSLILGRPGKLVRELTPPERTKQAEIANYYLHYKTWYEGEKRDEGVISIAPGSNNSRATNAGEGHAEGVKKGR